MTTTHPTPSVVLAVDGNSLAHRAFHAYGPRDGAEPLMSSDGQPRWATYGFLRLLLGVTEQVNPDAIIVAFDDPTSSHRKTWDPNYKANRSAKDESLYTQMRDISKVLSELGVSVVLARGWEADDVVGSTAHIAEQLGSRCVIATSDRDSFQLISDTTSVFRILNGMRNSVMMGPDDLYDTYGVRPHQYLDYSAMRGDKSDNLVGVTGIAEKTAAKILEWGSVADVLADPAAATEALGKGPVNKVLAGVDAWEHNTKMMRANRDLAIPVERSGIGHADRDQVAEILRSWEMPSLVRGLTELLCTAPQPAVELPSADVVVPNSPEGLFDTPAPAEDTTVTGPREFASAMASPAEATQTPVPDNSSGRPHYPGADWPKTLR